MGHSHFLRAFFIYNKLLLDANGDDEATQSKCIGFPLVMYKRLRDGTQDDRYIRSKHLDLVAEYHNQTLIDFIKGIE